MADRQLDLSELIEGAISCALGALFGDAPAATLSRARVEHHLRIVARDVTSSARDMTLLDLMTTDDMAAELSVSRRRVQALAKRRGLGWRAGRDLVFLRSEVEAMRPGPTGRPRKSG